MDLDTLQALYVEKLRDLYSAETQILKAMPKVRKGATHPELQDAFDTHITQTEEQVQRLDRIFEELGLSPKGKHCKGMEGLLAEANELLGEDADPDVMDAGLISAAQAVEHYEMAGYGTARTYADLLGFDDQSELLQQTLKEEEETDHLLTEIAMTSVNIDAMDDDSDSDSESDVEPERETVAAKPAKAATRKTAAKKSGGSGTRGRGR